MSTIKLGNGPGGMINGNFGQYQPGSDGFYTVDVRDVPFMLSLGLTYLRQATEAYTLAGAPRVASAGRIAASASLTNGPISIAAQPDVPRAVNVIMGAGTSVPTAGSVAVTYKASDGTPAQVDTFLAANIPISGSITAPLSKGCVAISTIVVGGVTLGTSPWVRLDDTNLMALPADLNAQDFTTLAEYDTGTLQTTPGTASTTAIGTTTIQGTPNTTATFSFVYSYTAPLV